MQLAQHVQGTELILCAALAVRAQTQELPVLASHHAPPVSTSRATALERVVQHAQLAQHALTVMTWQTAALVVQTEHVSLQPLSLIAPHAISLTTLRAAIVLVPVYVRHAHARVEISRAAAPKLALEFPYNAVSVRQASTKAWRADAVLIQFAQHAQG